MTNAINQSNNNKNLDKATRGRSIFKTINLSKLIVLFKYYTWMLLVQLIIAFCVAALNFSLGFIANGAGSVEIAMLVYGFTFGATFLISSFKVALINGISRKTFFLSSIAFLIVCAIAFGLMCASFLGIAHALPSNNTIIAYLFLYGNTMRGYAFWIIALMLCLLSFGMMVRLIFYRLTRNVTYIVLGALVVLGSLLVLWNILSNGEMILGVWRFYRTIMGFFDKPYIGILSHLTLSAIYSTIIFLLLRRLNFRG